MPMTKAVSGPDLAIQVYPIGRAHRPGDVVRGRVIRQTAPTVSPLVTAVIRLAGRIKVRIAPKGTSRDKVTYRSRFLLLNERQVLYTGPLRIDQSGVAPVWEFAIFIPYNSHPRRELRNSLEPSDLSAIQPLPGSFVGTDGVYLGAFFTFVEYFLHASLTQQGQNHRSSTALQPIRLEPFAPAWLSSFRLQRSYNRDQCTSYHLVSGRGNQRAHLSFKERTQELLQTNRVPKLSFTLQIDLPGEVQLDHPEPLPFYVRVIPDRRLTSKVLRDVPYRIYIEKFKLVLEAWTTVESPGTRAREHKRKHHVFPSKKTDSSTSKAQRSGLKSGSLRLELPFGWDDERTEVMDLGSLLDLRIEKLPGDSDLGGNSWRPNRIDPSFSSRGVIHEHVWRWKMTVVISESGQSSKFNGRKGVTVVGAHVPTVVSESGQSSKFKERLEGVHADAAKG